MAYVGQEKKLENYIKRVARKYMDELITSSSSHYNRPEQHTS